MSRMEREVFLEFYQDEIEKQEDAIKRNNARR